jgi:flavin reductase (DIM6/NTAB) family NADH-FMN oxidoreductase RutF
MFKEIKLSKSNRLLEPGCVILVTTGTMDRKNVMTFSWQTSINSGNPHLVLLSIGKGHYSNELIKENPELVINIPGSELLEKVNACGRITGRKVDKFEKYSLTAKPATLVTPPVIEECMAYLECKVIQTISIEQHDLLICNVLRAEAEDSQFDGEWILEKARTLHFLGGNKYGVLSDKLLVAG